MRPGKEFWIIEFKRDRPARYVMESGELTYLCLHAKSFESEQAAVAQMKLWRLDPAKWGPTRRITPGASTRGSSGTAKPRD
jgi:hypothetical protein